MNRGWVPSVLGPPWLHSPPPQVSVNRPLSALALAASLVLVSCDDGVAPSAPASIEVDAEPIELPAIGAWHALSVRVLDPSGGRLGNVEPSFASSDPSVASVTGEGIITAVGNGQATVTVSVSDLSADVSVIVDQVVTALAADTDTISFMDPGDTASVAVAASDALGANALSGVNWTSRAPGVATVDGVGRVEAVSTGEAFVVAEADGAADSVLVRVAPELTIVEVGATALGGVVDGSVNVAARVEDMAGAAWSGGRVSWSVGAGSGRIESAQEVDSDVTGHVGAVWRLGTTAGTQRAFAQIESRGGLTIVEFVADVGAGTPVDAALVADSVLLSAVGESAFLGPTYYDAWGNVASGAVANFSSADSSIVSVSPDGLLVGTGEGATMIYAAMPEGGDSILVTVVPRGAITVTFDDGWRSVYDNALPVVRDFDFVANVAVYVDATSFELYMNEDQLDVLHDEGWSLVSHTMSHSSLPTLNAAELDYELRASQVWLNARGYRGANVLIAPYHDFDEPTRAAAAEYYAAARGASSNIVTPDSLVAWKPSDPYELTGIDVEQLPYTTVEGRERLRTLLQRTADEGAFLDVVFHQVPPENQAALRATLEIVDDFRDRVLPYHELFPVFARSIY